MTKARKPLHPALEKLRQELQGPGVGPCGWYTDDFKAKQRGDKLVLRYHLVHPDRRGGSHLIEHVLHVEDGTVLINEEDEVCGVNDPKLVEEVTGWLCDDPVD